MSEVCQTNVKKIDVKQLSNECQQYVKKNEENVKKRTIQTSSLLLAITATINQFDRSEGSEHMRRPKREIKN